MGPEINFVKLIIIIVLPYVASASRIRRQSSYGIVSPWEQSRNVATLNKIKAAPVPAIAIGPTPLPNKSYYRQEVAYGVHYVNKNGYNAMFIVTNSGVIAVDAPPLIGEDLMAAIKDVTTLPITHQIYSHSHIDHIAGSTIFGDIERIAHIETTKLLQKWNDPKRPIPTRTFNDSTMKLEIGGKTIQLDYKGPTHVAGNIFVWLPNEKVLYSVDTVTPGWAAYTRLDASENVASYLESPDIILSYPFLHFVGGHLGKLGTRQDVVSQKEYLEDVQKNAIIATSSVNITDIANSMEDPTNIGHFDFLLSNAKADKCSELTMQKWATKLGGVDLYTWSNCDAVLRAQYMNYGQNVIG